MSAEQTRTIWNRSRTDCRLPNDKWCDACCRLNETAIGLRRVKPAYTPCPLHSTVLGHGNGCSIHDECYEGRKFRSCADCDPNEKLDLIATALSSKFVTEKQAEEAVQRLAKNVGQETALKAALDFVRRRYEEIQSLMGPPRIEKY